MRIAVVGAGALGSVIGGLLHEAGLDPVFIERDRDEVRLVKEQGLRLEGVSGDRYIRPRIVAEASEAGAIDLALVLVKSYDTAASVETLKQILAPDGLVLTLQNGIGNYETLNQAFPGQVLLGTTTMGAMTLGPGRFRHTGLGQTHFGEADGRVRERTSAVGAILEKMNGGPVHVVDNAVGCVWSKLIINAAINAPATLLRVRNGDLPASPAGRQLIHKIVEECLTIVRAKKINLIFQDPEATVIAVCEGTAGNVNSMFQDIRAGRRTEIDFINGALAKEAKTLGISVPVNRALSLLIKALEATSSKRVPDQAD
ncbi:MAG: 2-dehydropantoate 2-reductase [Desulfomonile tiedjei]|nr:2-dehydropantoate 2-reductase [Desulfomonile tiedjei]